MLAVFCPLASKGCFALWTVIYATNFGTLTALMLCPACKNNWCPRCDYKELPPMTRSANSEDHTASVFFALE